jgi:hypothetical protein
MCEDTPYADGLRDGKTTETIPLNQNRSDILNFGQHETFQWWSECSVRERNKGLYVADQDMNNRETAIHTRQSNNGNKDRHGFECPEERDYYPYWHPTPWRDIAILTSEPFRCSYYQQNSQNILDKGFCRNPIFNNEQACKTGISGITNTQPGLPSEWIMAGSWNTSVPECLAAPTTRNNHNGNEVNKGESPSYTWTIPRGIHADKTKCTLRIRYNISTMDYDGWNTDKFFNAANSPVTGNPTKDFLNLGLGVSGPLKLAVDTDQYGRTFEDRSHVFLIRKQPLEVNGWNGQRRIVNLNVRGRRGNIQQVYPSVEYDFVPTRINIQSGDFLHVQWTGSDANDRNNAGQGKAGTDRNNIVLIPSLGKNYPINLNPLTPIVPPQTFANLSVMSFLAYLNQTNCDVNQQDNQANNNCKLLNASPAYINAGLIRMDYPGTYFIMGTRNNRFSNREQKGEILVTADLQAAGVATGYSFGGLAVLSALTIFFFRGAKRKIGTKSGQEIIVKEFDDPEDELHTVHSLTFLDRHPILQKIVDWYEWEAPKIRFIAILFFCCVIMWLYGYLTNLGSSQPYFPFAKGFGKVLDLSCSFILLPVLRY